jgi:hypothetical protein
MRMNITHRVQKFSHLSSGGRDDSRVGVTSRGDAESRRQIEILSSLRVPDVDALGPLPDNWPGTVGFLERHIARLVSLQ